MIHTLDFNKNSFMKSVLKKIGALTFGSAFLIISIQCKKNADHSATDSQDEKLVRAKKFIESKLAKGEVVQTVSFQPGQFESKSSGKIIPLENGTRINTFCNATPTLDPVSFSIKYTSSAGCSGSPSYTFKAFLEFSITFSSGVTFNSLMSNFMTFHLSTTGTYTSPLSVSSTYLGQSGNTYFFKTADIDLDANGINYCNVDGFYIEIMPVYSCNGSPLQSTDVYNTITSITNFSRCQTISPVFAQRTSNTTADISGWVTCTPCNFLGSEQFEFQYRQQGTSTWTTVNYDYYLGPYTIFSLSSGVTYEYRHRNKINTSLPGTTAPCYGPYSSVGTF